MVYSDTHILYIIDNTFFVIALFALFFAMFLYCFRIQIEDTWPDAIFYAGMFTISLFFFWLLHHEPLFLFYVVFILILAMFIWMIKF